jgi:hypothetical protein
MKVGCFPRDDTHLIVLTMSTRSLLRLLVVPPDHHDGDAALIRAATADNRWTAAGILRAPAFDVEGDPQDHWHDSGGNWWRSGTAPPSFR